MSMKIKIIQIVFLLSFLFQLKKSFAFGYPQITYLVIGQVLPNNSVSCSNQVGKIKLSCYKK